MEMKERIMNVCKKKRTQKKQQFQIRKKKNVFNEVFSTASVEFGCIPLHFAAAYQKRSPQNILYEPKKTLCT